MDSFQTHKGKDGRNAGEVIVASRGLAGAMAKENQQNSCDPAVLSDCGKRGFGTNPTIIPTAGKIQR